jgi:hypothetical protein
MKHAAFRAFAAPTPPGGRVALLLAIRTVMMANAWLRRSLFRCSCGWPLSSSGVVNHQHRIVLTLSAAAIAVT